LSKAGDSSTCPEIRHWFQSIGQRAELAKLLALECASGNAGDRERDMDRILSQAVAEVNYLKNT
jgi:hypothetical protein